MYMLLDKIALLFLFLFIKMYLKYTYIQLYLS